MFDFGERAQEHRFGTLDLRSIKWSDDVGLTVEYSFLIGYPTASSEMELDEEGAFQRFVNKWIRQDLQPAAPRLMDVENRDVFIKHANSTRSSVEPDGLSGSPVFSIVSDAASDRHLRFDGIVTNAIGDRFAVYPSVHIRDFLDVIVAETPGESESAEAVGEAEAV